MDDLLARIADAHAARPEYTPLQRSPILSAVLDCELYLKCDNVQPTGSFKIRGASNKIRLLDAEARKRGVITASTGNHGRAVAHAARAVGMHATVFVASSTTAAKIDGIKALGAELVLVDGNPLDAELKARATAATQEKTYISPYNDLDVVAGQGTLGCELLKQLPDMDAVFISTGCGGLIGGTGTALKAARPEINVAGVWAENSPCLLRALEAGAIIPVEEKPTLSEGSAGAVEPGSVTFPICQQVIGDRIAVSEAEIASAMRLVAKSDNWMVEGAAGVALAGLVRTAKAWQGKKVVVVLCGRNIALDQFIAAIDSVSP